MGYQCSIRDKDGKFLSICQSSGVSCAVCEYKPRVTYLLYWLDGQRCEAGGFDITSHYHDIQALVSLGVAEIVNKRTWNQ